MSPPEDRGRTEPAKPVRGASEQDLAPPEQVQECPDCHATSVGEVPFCGSCGYDFVTGVSAHPPRPPAEEQDAAGPASGPGGQGGLEAPRRPTALQAGEPHEAYIDPRRDAEDIELQTRPDEVALDQDDLEHRPDVPPPTPPTAEQEYVAHETPDPLPPSRTASGNWVAEIWVDHGWAATRDSDQPVPDAGPPTVVPLTGTAVVIGRTNLPRGLRPDLDAGTDAGVSVRHAQLTSDGEHWWVEDLDTSNGTYVSTVGLELPVDPIESGLRVRVDEDDRVYLGGWTRLILRRRA